MALKLKKLPKRPKKTASLAAKQNYLNKLNEVKKYNQRVIAMRKATVAIDKRIEKAIAGFGKCK